MSRIASQRIPHYLPVECHDDDMVEAHDRAQEGRLRRISHRNRIALAVAGIGSWAAGGAASFLSSNGAGAAALVAVGGICGVLGLMGRWPSRVSMVGSELSWEDVQKTVDSQIRAAENGGEGDTVLAELEELRERLSTLQRTGAVPEHPAQVYDRAVRAAIERLLPGAKITRQAERSRDVADFVLSHNGSDLLIETKWRSNPAQEFGGSTLPQLLQRLSPGARLLVIVNAVPMRRARAMIEASLGSRGGIVTWRDINDDRALGEALTSLLSATSQPAQ